MDSMTLKRDDWKLLLDKPPGKCVSLYMPTHRSGPEIQQNPVRLKNLLRQAEGRLLAAGLKPAEAAEVLKPAENMVSDALAWTQRSDGLALFCAPDFFRSFHLPLAFKERVVSGDRFYLRPLSPLLQGNGHFHVLALSLHQVRLLAATRDSVRRIDLQGGVPTSFEEAMGTLQSAGTSRLGRTGFHGHGDSDQEKLKEEILHYFQQVARGLPELLNDRQTPLVLAAVEEHFPLFREANRHLTVLDDGLPGNPEHLSDRELQEKAWKVAEAWFLRERDEALGRYVDLDGGARTSNDIKELVPAAHQGRVDALFLASEPEQWGSFDPATGEVKLHPEGDEDLIDAAAFYTLLQGGKVYALDSEEVPGGAAAAAVFRY